MKTLMKLTIWMFLAVLVVSCKKQTETPVTPITPGGNTSGLTVTAISPDYGKGGDQVTITGTGFSATMADNTVTIGSIAATVTAATATQLKITAPTDGTHGTVNVKVGTNTATGPMFYYEPQITSLSATTGKAGDAITITGKNFGTTAADFEVKFNGTVAEITAVTTTTLAVKVPTAATTGIITVARKTKTAVNGPSFTIATGTSANAFTVTDGSISFTKLLPVTGNYGFVLCFTVDDVNNMMYVGTTSQILKIDLTTNAVTTMMTNASIMPTVSQPSAMDVGPDGKLYLLVDRVTIGGLPANTSNVYAINTSTNAATIIGTKFIGINIGGSVGDSVPFMVNGNGEFFTMDGAVGQIAKYSPDLVTRTQVEYVAGTESFHHMFKNVNNSIRIVNYGITYGKGYFDYTTSLSSRTDYPLVFSTDLLTITRGGTSFYAVQMHAAADAAANPGHTLFTVGKLNATQTGFDKKASFTADSFQGTGASKTYSYIPLNGKTYFFADKNGNMYAMIYNYADGDGIGIYKLVIN